MTQLSAHFSREEMTVTVHRDMDNTPPPEALRALAETALRMEAVRDILGGLPIHVTSGYRSPAINVLVGGSPSSDHPNGRACDFICPQFGTPLTICRAIVLAGVKFDQLIQEGEWVHIGFGERMRGQVKTKNPLGGYRPGLPET